MQRLKFYGNCQAAIEQVPMPADGAVIEVKSTVVVYK
jgi:hypothetical protein